MDRISDLLRKYAVKERLQQIYRSLPDEDGSLSCTHDYLANFVESTPDRMLPSQHAQAEFDKYGWFCETGRGDLPSLKTTWLWIAAAMSVPFAFLLKALPFLNLPPEVTFASAAIGIPIAFYYTGRCFQKKAEELEKVKTLFEEIESQC